MHVVAFMLAIAAVIVFGLAALGRDYPRPQLIPFGLLLATVAWVVQLCVETSDPVLL